MTTSKPIMQLLTTTALIALVPGGAGVALAEVDRSAATTLAVAREARLATVERRPVASALRS